MYELYFQKINELLALINKMEKETIKAAGEKIAQSIQNEGIVHVFGCGHSHILGEEVFYRAGGLAPINPILIPDLMLHKGAVRSSNLEKKDDYADQFLPDLDIRSEDAMLVVSTSGRNPVPIDVAQFAKQQEASVITISSHIYAKNISSRHKSGKYLSDFADIAIDNHIPIGDALLKLSSSVVPFGPGSTVIGTAIINGIMVEAINHMVKTSFLPPIFKSSNIDGAEEHNRYLIDKYKSRIPLLEN
ncbi:SIS domain-containing protein [Neobacillus cucumis]|uniref:SIS domain-containing protein n=1 Tax=Neobacillus cucumis TaxID=1740721 RepID=UPI002E1D5B74|nr:SIS domain-containing protein [Neobacillus cucumis]